MSLLLQLSVIYFGADFISGLFHWIEDTYLYYDPDLKATRDFPTSYLQQVAMFNEEHHDNPSAFTKCEPMVNIISSLPPFFLLLFLLVGIPYFLPLVLGMPPLISVETLWVIVCMLMFALFSNLFHRWCHIKPPTIINILQNMKFLQTPEHHSVHHFAENVRIPRLAKGTYYCVIGNCLNPLLEWLQFWRGLEFVIYKVCGLKPLWRKH